MSLKTLPIIYLNMGGEMLYILDQRLQAQNVKREKSAKVLNDIVGTMFNNKFVEELFKSQELCSKRAMRTLFDKLAHASIMRLNTTSMDKLYDLMTMSVKYQLQATVSPRDILGITLNHMDGIRKLVQGSNEVLQQIDQVYSHFITTYKPLSVWELYLVRLCVLNFYQDTRIKVSILLREKKQNTDGRFVVHKRGCIPYGSLIPGSFRHYDKGKPGKTMKFASGGDYSEAPCEGSLEKTVQKAAERGTDLGTNMYKGDASADIQGGEGSSHGMKSVRESLAKEELDLLSHLMGVDNEKASTKSADFISLSLFETAEEEDSFKLQMEAALEEQRQRTIKIDASRRKKQDSLEAVLSEMNVKENKQTKSRGEEMLDLMDSTS